MLTLIADNIRRLGKSCRDVPLTLLACMSSNAFPHFICTWSVPCAEKGRRLRHHNILFSFWSWSGSHVTQAAPCWQLFLCLSNPQRSHLSNTKTQQSAWAWLRLWQPDPRPPTCYGTRWPLTLSKDGRLFHNFNFSTKRSGHTLTHPSEVYKIQIQKLFLVWQVLKVMPLREN